MPSGGQTTSTCYRKAGISWEKTFAKVLKLEFLQKTFACVTLPSIYKDRAIVIQQIVHGEYFRKWQSIHKICKNFLL